MHLSPGDSHRGVRGMTERNHNNPVDPLFLLPNWRDPKVSSDILTGRKGVGSNGKWGKKSSARKSELSGSGNPWAKQTVPEREGLCVCRPGGGGIDAVTQPPSALAPREDANHPQRAVRSRNSSIGSIFQTVAGLGPSSWELGPCQPRKAGRANPAATQSSAAAASGKAAPRTQ